MYDFLIITLKKFNAKLLFTHTDSLLYEIKTDDVYVDFYKYKLLFDFSNYPKIQCFMILSMKKPLVK